ncbi:MAG: kinetochore-associated Ndc80 complex subunit spc24 [Alectoria fallacina]|uniref:Kinetochore protein Spc24 n=1 Tax=Alectoria fallacina TaxID=1903189 RepID=A0A8H3G0B0_9LECA|nr:MAG: kinetochore-associated Ndc80 complex subunit spc24 [Alectoria fallacina]
MLFDEDPAMLVQSTMANFHIDTDKIAIGRINESLSTLQQARHLRIREAESALKKLSRNFATMSQQHSETVCSQNSTDHASQIIELDTQKFRVAKAASDLEIEGERLEQELEGLKSRLHDLDVEGVEGGELVKAKREVDDPTILKLKVYRSLGIDVEADNAGNYNKAVIRNSRKGDVHVVNVDTKFSKFFYSNYFWQTVQ